jgi:hypothetical protein
MRDPFDATPPAVTAPDEVQAESTTSTAAGTAVTGSPDADTTEGAPAPEAVVASGEPSADVDDDEVWEADEVLASATDQARTALERITPADTIGEPLGYIVEGEHVLSLLFDCLLNGYPGWRWTVSLSRVDGDADPQVLETELTPGDDALLAPEWVPWSDRLADAKVAEELAAAELAGDDFDDDDADDDDADDDDGDDDDDDDDDTDDAADADAGADDGVDPLDGVDVDEALSATESAPAGSAAAQQDEPQTGQAESEADHGAPQPPVQARGMQFSSEDDGKHQGD